MNCTIYARHSSDLQNPRSADDQIRAIREDISKNKQDFKLTRYEFKDEAKSGRSVLGRSGLQAMYNCVKCDPGAFEAILVEDISRAFRNRYEAAEWREKFLALGVKILSMSDGYIDPDSESGVWLTGIKELKAHADSLETSRRTIRGQKAQAERGYSTGGPPPYGYKGKSHAVKSKGGSKLVMNTLLELDPVTAPTVIRIFQMYDKGYGFRELAKELNSERIPSARGGNWDTNTIRSVLRNEVYLGRRIYGKTKKVKRPNGKYVGVPQPRDNWTIVKNAHPAIVPQDLFEKIQTKLGNRAKLYSNTKDRKRLQSLYSKYPLSGLLKCGECGSNLTITVKGLPKNRTQYYYCGYYYRRGLEACTNRLKIRRDFVEEKIVGLLRDEIFKKDSIRVIVEKANAMLAEIQKNVPTKIETLRLRLEKIENHIRNIIRAIAEGIESDALKSELNTLEDEKKLLAQKIRDLDAAGDFQRIQVSYEIVEEYIMNLLSLFDTNPIMVKRELPKFIKEISLIPIRMECDSYYRGYVKVMPNRILGQFSTRDLLPSTTVNAGRGI